MNIQISLIVGFISAAAIAQSGTLESEFSDSSSNYSSSANKTDTEGCQVIEILVGNISSTEAQIQLILREDCKNSSDLLFWYKIIDLGSEACGSTELEKNSTWKLHASFNSTYRSEKVSFLDSHHLYEAEVTLMEIVAHPSNYSVSVISVAAPVRERYSTKYGSISNLKVDIKRTHSGQKLIAKWNPPRCRREKNSIKYSYTVKLTEHMHVDNETERIYVEDYTQHSIKYQPLLPERLYVLFIEVVYIDRYSKAERVGTHWYGASYDEAPKDAVTVKENRCEVQDQKLTLAWDPPSTPNGYIVEYQVQCADHNVEEFIPLAWNESRGNNITVHLPDRYVEYSCNIWAWTVGGRSPPASYIVPAWAKHTDGPTNTIAKEAAIGFGVFVLLLISIATVLFFKRIEVCLPSSLSIDSIILYRKGKKEDQESSLPSHHRMSEDYDPVVDGPVIRDEEL